MKNEILYISYDGLSDPLGRSQIIPYLTGLAGEGFKITILSCEKIEKLRSDKGTIKNALTANEIDWHYIIFRKRPPLLSTAFNLVLLKRKAFSLQRKNQFSIIHCRSYLSSLIGVRMKKKFGLKFIFDMRGLWADERVEGGLWNLKNPLYKSIYNFFKRKENEFLLNADHIIALTEKAANFIRSRKHIPAQSVPIKIIPCCADTNHFSKDRINVQELQLLKSKLGISENDFILSYLGSIGTWYCLDEMLLFFKKLLTIKPNSKFLFITHDDPNSIFSIAKKYDIRKDKLIIQSAKYAQVPLFLTLSTLSLCFIKPSFSKTASSPTKLAETWSMGITLICNSGIGDTDDIIQKSNCGLIIPEFNEVEFDKAIAQLETLLNRSPEDIRAYVTKNFSLESGVRKYSEVYAVLLSPAT